MKQSILILTLILVMFTSCLEEGINGCPDYIRLKFTYEESTGGYDQVIANDVHIRIYNNAKIWVEEIIPYELIKQGQEYVIKKQVTGEIDIIAWAIPAEKQNVATIPMTPESRAKTDEKIELQPAFRSTQHESMGEIYLGTVNYYDADITQEISIAVPMKICIAEFSAAIHTAPELNLQQDKETIWLEVLGTKTQMDASFKPMGEDAYIMAPLINQDEKGVLSTEVHGLLPSDKDQYIAVKAYKEDKHLFTIYTEHQAKPGDKIHLDIFANSVTVYINHYRIFTQVEWI